MKLRRLVRLSLGLLLGLTFVPAVAPQQASPPQQPQQANKPKPGRGKVWTNEDLAGVRKPSDLYLDQKLAAEEAAKAAKETPQETTAAAPAQEGTVANKPSPPKTLEEAEARIAKKREEIRNLGQMVRRTREEHFNASNDQARGVLNDKIVQMTGALDVAEAELRSLEARLEELLTEARSQPLK